MIRLVTTGRGNSPCGILGLFNRLIIYEPCCFKWRNLWLAIRSNFVPQLSDAFVKAEFIQHIKIVEKPGGILKGLEFHVKKEYSVQDKEHKS